MSWIAAGGAFDRFDPIREPARPLPPRPADSRPGAAGSLGRDRERYRMMHTSTTACRCVSPRPKLRRAPRNHATPIALPRCQSESAANNSCLARLSTLHASSDGPSNPSTTRSERQKTAFDRHSGHILALAWVLLPNKCAPNWAIGLKASGVCLVGAVSEWGRPGERTPTPRFSQTRTSARLQRTADKLALDLDLDLDWRERRNGWPLHGLAIVAPSSGRNGVVARCSTSVACLKRIAVV